MAPAEPVNHESAADERATLALEELVTIAVVIGAGCERCAESLVRRALRRGRPQPPIERTLAIVGSACSAECLLQAVGPEVIARMKKSLQAGKKALRQAHPSAEDHVCRG